MRTTKVYATNHPEDMEFWNIKALKKLLSHNADISIATSPRGFGKSYSAMQLVDEGLRRGENSVWERYNRVELGSALEAWQNFRPDLEKSVLGSGSSQTGWKLTDPETGAYVALIAYNRSQNIKGLDDCFIWEVKDEFIPERYTEKTRMDTEYRDSMSVYKSIRRKYDTRSIYLANCINWINPYSIAWSIPPVDRGFIWKAIDDMSIVMDDGEVLSESRTIVWENIKATKAILRRSIKMDIIEARSSEELQGYYNNMTKQEYSRIGECPDKSQPFENLQLMSEGYYMGYRIHDGSMYWSKIKQRSDIETYVSEPEYIDPTKRCFRDRSLSPQIEEWFNAGLCVFDSPETLVALERWLFHNRRRIA